MLATHNQFATHNADELGVLSRTLRWGRGDQWARSIARRDREVLFELHPPSNDASDPLDAVLMPSIRLAVYFPQRAADPPLCFVEPGPTDEDPEFTAAVARVADAANKVSWEFDPVDYL